MKNTFVKIIGFLIFGNLVAYSQEKDSLDIQFLEVKKLEKTGNRIEAKKKTDKLIAKYPTNVDVAIFGAQLKAFDNEFPESLARLQKLIDEHPKHYDVIAVYIDVLRWNNENIKSIQYCDTLLKYYPKNEEIFIKKGKALEIIQKNEDAKTIYKEVLATNPTQEDALIAIKRLNKVSYKNHFGIFYANTSFKESMRPWHMGGFEWMRKKKIFPLRAQLTMATRYDEFASQLELEAYPKLNKKMSLHVGVGFSNNDIIFPNWRSTLDIYRTLPNKFEAAIGFRTLKYPNGINMIYASYLGKYYKNYWILYRGYYYTPPNESKMYFSHTAQVRRYYNDPDNYTAATLFTGNTPFSVGWLNQISGVKTQGFNIEQQLKINDTRLIKLVFMYENEEFVPNKTRNKFTLMGTLITRF